MRRMVVLDEAIVFECRDAITWTVVSYVCISRVETHPESKIVYAMKVLSSSFLIVKVLCQKPSY